MGIHRQLKFQWFGDVYKDKRQQYMDEAAIED